MLDNHSVRDPYAVFRSSATPVGLYALRNKGIL
jgi:hypothetical protein